MFSLGVRTNFCSGLYTGIPDYGIPDAGFGVIGSRNAGHRNWVCELKKKQRGLGIYRSRGGVLCRAIQQQQQGSTFSEDPSSSEISLLNSCGLDSTQQNHGTADHGGEEELLSIESISLALTSTSQQQQQFNSISISIHRYYQTAIEADPCNSLLLTNYAKFLHEAEENLQSAEYYYQRAMVASSPADGQTLCLYAKLVWDLYHDPARADSYFQQAIHASPDDSFVLGSYAHFLWNLEEGEDQEHGAGVASAKI